MSIEKIIGRRRAGFTFEERRGPSQPVLAPRSLGALMPLLSPIQLISPCQVKQFLDLIPRCVYIQFPTSASNSQTTPGYLRIQLNSDDVYQKIASVSTGEGLSHIRSPSTSNVSRKSKLLCALLTSWLQNGGSSFSLQLGIPMTSPGCSLYF